MRIIAIVQARMGSTRLPNKVMLKVGKDLTMIEALLLRLSRSKKVDKIVLATSTDIQNQTLVNHVNQLSYDTYKGDENDVLGRYYKAA